MLLIAAALAAGAAVSSSAAANVCSYAEPDLRLWAESYETIVIARAGNVTEDRAEFVPEAFLKGPVAGGRLVLTNPDRTSTCAPAAFGPGERWLLFLDGNQWPIAGSALKLVAGDAVWLDGALRLPEREAVDQVRAVTGQYAIPPQSAGESQGIEWSKTVVPVGGALLGIFVVGLFLMRIWHRIDPS